MEHSFSSSLFLNFAMSNITSCDSGSFSTENTRDQDGVKHQQQNEILGQFHSPHSHTSTTTTTNNSNDSNTNLQPPLKRKGTYQEIQIQVLK